MLDAKKQMVKQYLDKSVGKAGIERMQTDDRSAFSVYQRQYKIMIVGTLDDKAMFSISSVDITPTGYSISGSDKTYDDVLVCITDSPRDTGRQAIRAADPDFFNQYPNANWR